MVLDSAPKFLDLLMGQNPNVLQILWLREEDYLLVDQSGRLLIENRQLFRCRSKAFKSFVGYAKSRKSKELRDGAHELRSGGDTQLGLLGGR